MTYNMECRGADTGVTLKAALQEVTGVAKGTSKDAVKTNGRPYEGHGERQAAQGDFTYSWRQRPL